MSATDSASSFPFGEQIAGGSITTHKSSGDERSSETELDQAWFRQYPFQLDRSMHPDPAGLAAVDPTDPQSWSLYAHDVNNHSLSHSACKHVPSI